MASPTTIESNGGRWFRWLMCLLISQLAQLAQTLMLHGRTVTFPQPDLTQLGRVGFTGDFNAFSVYTYGNSIVSTSGTVDEATVGGQSIRVQFADGTFANLAPSNGALEKMCLLSRGTDGQPITVVVAGNFTELASHEAESIAAFNYDSNEVTAFPGIKGQVQALLCDSSDSNASAVYVTGSFASANSTNALIWTDRDGWVNLPFGGTDGQINAMEKTSAGTILFGGSFSGLETGETGLNGIKLNGLLEWDRSQQVFNSSEATPIMKSSLGLDAEATVTQLLAIGELIFVAGNFSGPDVQNIFAFAKGEIIPLPAGGLNGPVASLLYLSSLGMIVVGGDFSGTADQSLTGLNNVAGYSIDRQQWQPLGAGVNGAVSGLHLLSHKVSADQLEAVVIIDGQFDQILPFSSNGSVPIDGIAAWVPSRNNWLSNLEASNQVLLGGRLSAVVGTPGNLSIFAGSFSSWDFRGDGAVEWSGIGSGVLISLGLTLLDNNSLVSRNVAKVGCFSYFDMLATTIIGGSFVAETNGLTPIYNLALLEESNQDQISGLPNFTIDASVESLSIINHVLFVGGSFQQTIRGQTLNGLLLFNLSSRSYAETQPPSLGGDTTLVQVMSVRPYSSKVYVGGTFDTAGGLECPSVCAYDTSSSTWARPGSNLGGSVRSMIWTSEDALVAAGNITIEDRAVSMASYYAPKDQWTPFNELHDLTGEVTAMTQAFVASTSTWSSDAVEFWVTGKDEHGAAFLKKWNGTSWLNVTTGFERNSTFLHLNVLSLINEHAANPFLNPNNVLLVVGNILLPGLGSVSAALFDGTDFFPFVATRGASGSGSLSSAFFENEELYSESPDNRTIIAILATVIAVIISIILVGELENLWHQHSSKLKLNQ